MGVFTVADALRTAAIDAGHELGLFEALTSPLALAELAERTHVRPTHRFTALVDALIALGALVREGDRIARGSIVPRSAQPMMGGWGAIADVIRSDTPLVIEDADIARRYQRHLVVAGAPAAREVAEMLVACAANGALELGIDAGADKRGASDVGGNAGEDERVGASDAGVRAIDIDGGADARTARGLRAIDIGGGAGAYTRALLVAEPRTHVTLVDMPDVVELARVELEEFAERVHFVAGDARNLEFGTSDRERVGDARNLEFGTGDAARAGDARNLEFGTGDRERAGDARKLEFGTSDAERGAFDVAIVANVLHLHSPAACAGLCATAARAIAPGGLVAIVDLRRGTLEGEMFALNMTLYTEGGSVYSVEQIGEWLRATGVVAIEERTLVSAPEMVVVLGRKPRGEGRGTSGRDRDDNGNGAAV